MSTDEKNWRETAAIFDRQALEYDRWFERSLVYEIEKKALLSLLTAFNRPMIEIGVGPGRFAAALGVKIGFDPALSPLKIARKRDILVSCGIAEELPCKSARLGTVFLVMTLCFLRDPELAIREISRCLKPGGHLVIGLVPRSSPWGRSLTQKKEVGNPFYAHARFREVNEVEEWLKDAGFEVTERRSTLFQPPGETIDLENSVDGFYREAGFVVLVARKKHG